MQIKVGKESMLVDEAFEIGSNEHEASLDSKKCAEHAKSLLGDS